MSSSNRRSSAVAGSAARTPSANVGGHRNAAMAGHGSGSSMSELTTPSASLVAPRRLGTHTQHEIGSAAALASLADSPSGDEPDTPIRALVELDEEEEMEARWYSEYENGDSDDENPSQVDTMLSLTVAERAIFDEDNNAVLDTFEQYLGDYADDEPDKPLCNAAIRRDIPGAPASWRVPSAPDDWEEAELRADQPAFDKVDNPGNWSSFTFRPTFIGTAKANNLKYVQHVLPTGAMPVPKDDEGDRKVKDWHFHYKGWTGDATVPIFRSGATRDNMFPECRKGSLDEGVLHRLGLTVERMQEKDGAPDALFFYQLLLPMHNINNKVMKSTTVRNDPRKPFYVPVSVWSNMYAAAGELHILGSGYGHRFEQVEPPELIKWDGSIVMDGVLGSSHGGMLRRFDTREDNTSFNKTIADAFTKSRWLEIKRVYKMCNNLTSKRRGEEGYDPAYKYDYLYDVLIHNVNAVTRDAGLDLCGDETTFGFNGWGEAGSGLLGLIMNKPGITRGGQIVVVSDVDRIRPRAYVHRHKLQPKLFTIQGQNEVRLICERLEPLINGPKPIFREMPHMTWDNFFSGDNIMNYVAEKGFGMTTTCRRDRLPKDIPGKYLHKGKTDSTARPKAARFEQPIFVIKKLMDDPNDPTKITGALQLTTFQSTSSCNLTSVNALNTCTLYCQSKERGRGANKRLWGIEMNEGRYLYLRTYGIIDRMDHLVQNCHMQYRSWKYWHAPMLHGKAIAVVIAYDMYLECCEGKMRAGEWKIKKPVSFHRFREKLATQMLKYTPKDRKYPGDECYRVSTRQHKDRRPREATLSSCHSNATTSSSRNSDGSFSMKRNDFKSTTALSRSCGDLTPLHSHLLNLHAIPNGGHKTCVVCGEQAYQVCMECIGPDGKRGVAMHKFARENMPVPCFYQHHNTSFYGLGKSECKLVNKRKKDWVYPTQIEIKEHARNVRHLLTANVPLPCSNSQATSLQKRTRVVDNGDNDETSSNSGRRIDDQGIEHVQI
jgi:hypothetical protein